MDDALSNLSRSFFKSSLCLLLFFRSSIILSSTIHQKIFIIETMPRLALVILIRCIRSASLIFPLSLRHLARFASFILLFYYTFLSYAIKIFGLFSFIFYRLIFTDAIFKGLFRNVCKKFFPLLMNASSEYFPIP